MAAKKTAKKTAAPAAEKAAPAAKKAAVKTAKKAAKTAAKKAAKPVIAQVNLETITQVAYMNYRRRVELGLPGDKESDWLEAERELLK